MCWWSFLNPRALTKFGLDYTRLKKQAPRIVYCSILGLGQGGPNAKNRLRLDGSGLGRDHAAHRQA